ncbi:MAG: hypothetical protein KDD69_11455, partial [Bdellovibrionales bacterium]|nr:hypothetical protein [Bdellovibrionales bacterium]
MKTATVWAVLLAGAGYFVFTTLLSEVSSCDTRESEVREQLALAASCSSDADCTILALSCPYDCETPINRNERSNVIRTIGSYNSSCMSVCPD